MVELIAWTSALAALVGLAQAEGLDGYGRVPSTSIDWTRYGFAGRILRATYEALAGLDAGSPGATLEVAWPDRLRRMFASLLDRPFGGLPRGEGPPASVFGHANLAAEIAAAGAVAMLVRVRAGLRAATPRRLLLRLPLLCVRIAALTAQLAYLHVAGARAPVLALVLAIATGAVVFLVSAPRGARKRRLVWAAVATLVGGVGFLAMDRQVAIRGAGPRESLVDRFRQILKPPDPARDTLSERRALWDNTKLMIAAAAEGDLRRPGACLGVGPGNWETEYPEYAGKARSHAVGTFMLQRRPDHAHQDPLELLAEHGLLGVATLSLLLAVAVVAAFGALRASSTAARDAVLGLALPILALLGASLTSFPFHTATPLIWACGVCGSLVGPRGIASLEPAAGRDARPATACLAATAFAGAAALGGAGLGAAIALLCGVAAAVAGRIWRGGGTAPRPRMVAAGLIALCAVGAIVAAVRACAPFASAAAAVGAALAFVAAVVPFDRAWTASPALLRLTAAAFAVAGVLGALGGRARCAASELFRTGAERIVAARIDAGARLDHARRAADALDAATARTPHDFGAEMQRSDAYAALGRFAAAETSAARTARLHRRLANAHVALANLAFARGAFEEARREGQEGVRWCEGALEARIILARALDARGDARGALAEFERAIAVAKDDWTPFARVSAAELRLRLGDDPARAFVLLAQAETQASRDAWLLERTARLFEHPLLPPEAQVKARAAYRRVHALDPTFPRPRLRVMVEPLRGTAPVSGAEAASLVPALDVLVAELPNELQAEARYWRAFALEQSGNDGEAARGYRDAALAAARLTPDDPQDDDVVAAAMAGDERIRVRGASRPIGDAAASTRTGATRPTDTRPVPTAEDAK